MATNEKKKVSKTVAAAGTVMTENNVSTTTNGSVANSTATSSTVKKLNSTTTTIKKTSTINNSPIVNSKSSATNNNNNNNSNTTDTTSKFIMDYVWLSIIVYCFYRVLYSAYKIRLGAIEEYGLVIHEFDPYFNYRATEYLYWNGYKRFFNWFDYKVWYPLGRPVGTTIYPGMQFTAVFIKQYIIPAYTLNDICCYIPAWFGVLTTIGTSLITYECTIPNNTYSTIFHFIYNLFIVLTTGKRPIEVVRNDENNHVKPITFLQLYSPAVECAVVTGFMMAIVPAHLMRSIGGGYDNESVAVPAMVWTCYFWIRSLRHNDSTAWIYGIIAGLNYFYMVASWGGYVFLINLIGVHAAAMVLFGRFNTTTVYRSYTLFYLIGTTLAMQIPVVGYTPIKSLEQLGPCIVFIGYQLLYITESIIESKSQINWTRKQKYNFRLQVLSTATIVAIIGAIVLVPTGYFGPFSARVRGLFVKHTKTGNPLVDSVAEHQPASTMAYFQYLHHVCTVAPIGFIIVLCQFSNSSSFLIIWSIAAYFFSHKMVRLILLTAPIGCILGGICVGRMLVWCLQQWWDNTNENTTSSTTNKKSSATKTMVAPIDTTAEVVDSSNDATDATTDLTGTGKSGGGKGAKGGAAKKGKKAGTGTSTTTSTTATGRLSSSSKNRNRNNNSNSNSSFDELLQLKYTLNEFSKTSEGILTRRGVGLFLIIITAIITQSFISFCWRLQHDLSNPSIILKGRTNDGNIITVDDYREAYWWLRDNTPTDSRIMAWWDYGYQISSIANRTTIADGNTWNHEHIALLGKALTTNLEEGYGIARHLADYVLIWSGGGGDDLAKSPHLARIATSVYRDHCPDDPTCRAFGFINRQQTPSAMMSRSLLYRLHQFKLRNEVDVPDDMFEDVYRSKYGKVRIYKVIGVSEESKRWVADPTNRHCDVPGSWFCPGQYPPGLSKILKQKNDFQQLEDFNRGTSGGDSEYQEKYFQNLQNPERARRKSYEKEVEQQQQQQKQKPQRGINDKSVHRRTQQQETIYNSWADTDDTTQMWRYINSNDIHGLKEWLQVEPHKAFVRSKDGRGPMWWAFEQKNDQMTKLLMEYGVPHTDVDAKGLSPIDLLESN